MSDYVFSVIDSTSGQDSFDLSVVILDNKEFEGVVFKYININLEPVDDKVGFVYEFEVSYLDKPNTFDGRKEGRLRNVASDLFEQVMKVFLNAAKKSGEYPELLSMLDI
jgi:hypothetical protein